MSVIFKTLHWCILSSLKHTMKSKVILQIYTHSKKVKHHSFLWRNLTKFPISCRLTIPKSIPKFLGHVFWKVSLDAAKINKVLRISFLSYGGYKMPNLNIFNFPNVSLPLVFCTVQKTTLANKHNAKWKKKACLMNNWKRFWQCISCHGHYRRLSAFCTDSYGNWNSLITSEIDNIWLVLVWISS